jgi:hypothetical protein
MSVAVDLLRGLANHPVGLFKNLVGFPAVLSVLALPVMKYYARPLPLWRLGLIAFGVFFPVIIISFAIYAYWIVASGAGMTIFEVVTFALIILAGFSITWCLKRQGFSKGFPGIGARTILSVMFFGAVLLIVTSVARIPI